MTYTPSDNQGNGNLTATFPNGISIVTPVTGGKPQFGNANCNPKALAGNGVNDAISGFVSTPGGPQLAVTRGDATTLLSGDQLKQFNYPASNYGQGFAPGGAGMRKSGDLLNRLDEPSLHKLVQDLPSHLC